MFDKKQKIEDISQTVLVRAAYGPDFIRVFCSRVQKTREFLVAILGNICLRNKKN